MRKYCIAAATLLGERAVGGVGGGGEEGGGGNLGKALTSEMTEGVL